MKQAAHRRLISSRDKISFKDLSDKIFLHFHDCDSFISTGFVIGELTFYLLGIFPDASPRQHMPLIADATRVVEGRRAHAMLPPPVAVAFASEDIFHDAAIHEAP